MKEKLKRPALILDRDGVINIDTGYLYRIEECRFIDGIFEVTRVFADRGFAIVIATNQTGIGRGYFGEAEFQRLMAWMREAFMRAGVEIAGIYHCPDHPAEGIGPYRRENPWRKPGPGMFLQAASDLGLDLSRSWTIGDKPRDLEAGRTAGVASLVLYDPDVAAVTLRDDFWIVPNLQDVVGLLERGQPNH